MNPYEFEHHRDMAAIINLQVQSSMTESKRCHRCGKFIFQTDHKFGPIMGRTYHRHW
jgi:rRNA maturation endonuclease Nob1